MISQWVIFHGRLLNDPRVYTIHRGQHLATGGHVPVMHQRCGRKADPHDVFAHSFFRPCFFFKVIVCFLVNFPSYPPFWILEQKKTMLVGQLPLQEGLLKWFGIFFKCLIWIDSPCKRFASILFVLSIFLLISHGFWSRRNHIVSGPILNRVTKLKRSFNCLYRIHHQMATKIDLKGP